MLSEFKSLIALSAIAAASGLFSAPAIAQEIINPLNNSSFELIELESIPNAFDEAINDLSGTSFEEDNLLDPVQWIFGFPAYPEVAINRDAKDAHDLYVEVFEQQVSSGPIIRTVDLVNPFSSSLRTSPSYLGPRTPVRGSEFLFEVEPIR